MCVYLLADMTRLTNSRILDCKANSCGRRVSLEINKQIIAPGRDVRRHRVSAECAQQRRRVVLPVVHLDVVIAALSVEREKL